MYKTLFLVISLTVQSIYFSQSDLFSRIKINQSEKLNAGNILSCIDNELIYYTPTNNSLKNRVIYRVKVNGAKLDSIPIKKSKTDQLSSERILQISYNNNELTILTNQSIRFYKCINSKFVFEKAIRNSLSFSKMDKIGKNLLLQVCYQFHPQDQIETNRWAVLDMNKKEIINVFEPNFDNSKFGFSVNSWVSTHEGIIAHASSYSYKVHFFDTLFQLVDSVVLDEKMFQINPEIIDKMNLMGKDNIAQFIDYADEHFSRIQKIFLLDSTHLLVFSKLANADSLSAHKGRIDLWVKQQKVWTLMEKSFGDIMFEKGSSYQSEKDFFGFLFQNVYSINVYQKQLISIVFPYYPIVNTNSFDYDKDINHYFKNESEFHYGLQSTSFFSN